MAWECLSANYSQTEIISAQRGIINNDILLIVQQCISAYGTYIGIYRPLGKVLNMDLITMVRDENVQLVKLFLKAHSFFPISTCVGKMDLYGKFMPYTNKSVCSGWVVELQKNSEHGGPDRGVLQKPGICFLHMQPQAQVAQE